VIVSILMTSNLRHRYIVFASSDGAFYNFLVTLNVEMNNARNYKNLLNFVKIMPKILVVPFFFWTLCSLYVHAYMTKAQIILVVTDTVNLCFTALFSLCLMIVVWIMLMTV